MDANEIMVNDEVMEVSEEIATANSGNGFMIAAGIGLAVLVGEMAYRYIIKPKLAKIKTKKEQQEIILDADDFKDVDSVETEGE